MSPKNRNRLSAGSLLLLCVYALTTFVALILSPGNVGVTMVWVAMAVVAAVALGAILCGLGGLLYTVITGKEWP